MKRRTFFLISSAIASLGATLSALSRSSSRSPVVLANSGTPLPERILGKTGESLPVFGLGGAGKTPLSWNGAESEAIAIIERALELGIRYFDTAASYGPSENYLGKVLPSYRSQVFLTTKTAARDRDGAWRELEQSLKRLQTDYLDAWQFHHVSFGEELDRIFAQDGAIAALEEAKAQKIVRFSGITGHHEPAILVEGLNRYPFDTTLVSINAADKHHPRPFIPTVLPVAQQKNVGVIAMKIPAYGKLLEPGRLTSMDQALGYILSQPEIHSCIVAAEHVTQLEENVKVAQAFQSLSLDQLEAIEKLTAETWQEATFFRRWT
ncbi:aldo/keto reductase [Roseofilum sp. Guam]|uniref:aldo/keto reductase n=1 Tax=Roseofilum sp. Guam TaxID=2821502 RepID=UPI001B0723CC|nr:aldo/keto reductase [Roseofilum sp. Guam]